MLSLHFVRPKVEGDRYVSVSVEGRRLKFIQRKKLSDLAVMLYYLLGLLFDPEHRGINFLRNVGELLPDYTASYSRSNTQLSHRVRTSSVRGQKQSKEKIPS
jgi:hypothetical protein